MDMHPRRAQHGFTLVELAIIVAIVGVMAGIGATAGGGLSEDGQALMAKSFQTTLQNILSQGVTRCHQNLNVAANPGCNVSTNAQTLNFIQVQQLLQARYPADIAIGAGPNGIYTLTINSQANPQLLGTYQVQTNGDVDFVPPAAGAPPSALLPNYRVDANGNIFKI